MTHANPWLFEPGDCMVREGFLALCEQMPDLKFAELIDGSFTCPDKSAMSKASAE